MAASVLAADPFVINTPASAVQCQTTVVTWTGGRLSTWYEQSFPLGPLALTDITDRAAARAQSIVHDRTSERHLGLTDRTFSWNTDLPANTEIFFFLIDGTSHTAQSSLIGVQPSTDNSCLQHGGSPSVEGVL
ncbi:uncharacterized protein TRAVEDRAFT_53495 [Trametes versicolor FP-101664 SS1]|uniref:uncharacterized protein n=1 Tax=Trametes versicolor (strain FP-101664) TaxID=717944 RepID=UPI0004622A4E|nr:uncharacterized protein TRAVEDRAFT_53495 [Trametes versicolor FP-101664 SS1]EIW53079.1 hypothetical protein TRAVEDRAFT_53495 [Trametes versicolor FP-101664 SS1]